MSTSFISHLSSTSLEMSTQLVVAYRLIFEPQEVAEVEIAVAQRHSGVALLEVAPRDAHLLPNLQFNLEIITTSN